MVGEMLGSFRIESVLGVGAMGVVYKATNVKTGKTVAVKVIAVEVAKSPKAFERFKREIEILQQFRHPNIVRFMAYGRYKGTYYFAMQFIPGRTLEKKLDEGPMPWQEVAEIGKQMCEALQYAHDHGVVHRDLKPSNLMVTEDGQVFLTDFGIAKDLDATALTATGRTLGTVAYMAPEQIRGTPEVSHKTDLYSLGVVFYQMLTGQTPFGGTSHVVMMHSHLTSDAPHPNAKADLPKAFDQLVVQLMSKGPTERPWDAAAVAQTLGKILDKAGRGDSAVKRAASNGEDAVYPARAGAAVATEPKKPSTKKKARSSKSGPRAALAEVRDHRWWLGTAGLVLSLLAFIALFVYALSPESAESLYQQAEKLIASEDRHDWAEAVKLIDKLDSRYPENEFKGKTQKWRDKSLLEDARRRGHYLEDGNTPINQPQNPTEEQYRKYYIEIAALLKSGDELGAALLYDQFGSLVDPHEPAMKGWKLLAAERAAELRASSERRRRDYFELKARYDDYVDQGRLEEARSIRNDVQDKYGRYKDVAELMNPPGGDANAPAPESEAPAGTTAPREIVEPARPVPPKS